MMYYAIKESDYQNLINCVKTFTRNKKFLIYKYKGDYYWNNFQYIEFNLMDTSFVYKFLSRLYDSMCLKVDKMQLNSMDSDLINQIYIDDSSRVIEFIERSIPFGNIYIFKSIKNIQWLYSFIELLLEYKNISLRENTYDSSYLREEEVYIQFKLECLWILLMFYDEQERSKYFSIKEVDNLPLYTCKLEYNDVLSNIVNWSKKYTLFRKESKYKLLIKDKNLYDNTLFKLQNFLSNYGFFGYKLGVTKEIFLDGPHQYVKSLFFHKSGNILNFNDSYFIYEKLNTFNSSYKIYSKYIDDNEIKIVYEDDLNKYENYYVVKYEDTYIWKTFSSIIVLLKIKERFKLEDIQWTPEDYAYMYGYLLCLTLLDDKLKMGDKELNILDESLLFDDLYMV